MSVIKDWNSWGEHPLAKYGEDIDYDGIRYGKYKPTFRGPRTPEEAEATKKRQEEHYQRHLELLRKKKEEEARIEEGLNAVTILIYILSSLLSGRPCEEVIQHHFPGTDKAIYFKQKGQFMTAIEAAGYVLRGEK
tara:strand:- start:13782 stop:14186 length:405 start_codon:yes stop_codon:yes gene_type:complete